MHFNSQLREGSKGNSHVTEQEPKKLNMKLQNTWTRRNTECE